MYTDIPTFTEVEIAADAHEFARKLRHERAAAEARIIEIRNRTLVQRWNVRRYTKEVDE